MAEQKVKLTQLPEATDTTDTAVLLVNQNETDQRLPITHLLRAKNNLSELENAAQARANLGVPSVEDVNDKIEYLIDGKSTFLNGATLESERDFIWDDNSKSWYYWTGAFSKEVPAASTPDSTGGIGAGKWLSVGDAILRGDLSLPSGAEHIGISPSGTLDDVINDVTPEQFGAIGDGITDDTAALKAMFKYINDMPISFTDTAAELNPHLDVAAKRVVLRGLYMHTETIFIPSGVQIFQPGFSNFRRNVQQGFYFNPPSGEGSMAAVSTYIYLKSGGTWTLNTDPMFLPSGAQIDSGDVRTGARHIDIINFSIITKPGTLLGLRWLGAAGCTTRNLSIGENTGSNILTARLPQVGFLQTASWSSIHHHSFSFI